MEAILLVIDIIWVLISHYKWPCMMILVKVTGIFFLHT